MATIGEKTRTKSELTGERSITTKVGDQVVLPNGDRIYITSINKAKVLSDANNRLYMATQWLKENPELPPMKDVDGSSGVGEKGGKQSALPSVKPNAESVELASKLSRQIAPAGFALIPGGEFQMGNVADQPKKAEGANRLADDNPNLRRSKLPGTIEDELPVHVVNVTTFFMSKHEVTKELWDKVRAWGLLHGYTDLAIGGSKALNHPVQMVSWRDAVKWCNAMSEMYGLTPCYYTDTTKTIIYKSGSDIVDNTMVMWTANGYRLPTEAEWEKAARGGLDGKRFPWGDTISLAQANFVNWAWESYQTGARGHHPPSQVGKEPYTSPVGSFMANGYGLYDMAGNVTEWCWDWYGGYTSATQTDPQGPLSGPFRVYRGGAWDTYALPCRVSYRAYGDGGYNDKGFRIARSAGP